MGCWNETCAVTNLPIYEGEKVNFHIITEQYNIYDFFCIPITGKYNDYGSIENIPDTVYNKTTFDVFKRLIEQNKIFVRGEKQVNDINDLVNCIERRNVFYDSGYDGFCKLHPFFIKAEVEDIIRKDILARNVYSTDETFLAHSTKRISERFAKIKSERIRYKNDEYYYHFDTITLERNGFREYIKMIIEGHHSEELISGFVMMQALIKGLAFMRKEIIPYSSGSQCDEILIHSKIADYVKGYYKSRSENESRTTETIFVW